MLPEHLILGQIYPPNHHFTSEQMAKYLPIAKAMDIYLENDHITTAKHAHLYHTEELATSKKDLAKWINDRLNTPFKGATKLYGVIDIDIDDLVAVAFMKTLPFMNFSTLAGVYVSPRYRNKGLFKSIHSYSVNLSDTKEIHLHTVMGTMVGDIPIDQIYEHLGYKPISTFHIAPMIELHERALNHTPKYYKGKDLKAVASDPSPYEAHILAMAKHRYNDYKRITLLDHKSNEPYISIKVVSDQMYSDSNIRWLSLSNSYRDTYRPITIDIMTKDIYGVLLDLEPNLKAVAYEVPVNSTSILHDILKGTPTYRKWSLTI